MLLYTPLMSLWLEDMNEFSLLEEMISDLSESFEDDSTINLLLLVVAPCITATCSLLI